MQPFTSGPYLTIITGHYGVGKTNLSLNLARDLSARSKRVTLIDLDIVNPYFRSTDSLEFLQENNVEVFGPVYARSTLDTPSLAPGIDEAIAAAGKDSAVLIDVGGDPDGARALGRYARGILARPHRLVFVVNLSRPDTSTLEQNLALLEAIEATAGLKVTHVLGNTHLSESSAAKAIAAAAAPTARIAKAAGVSFAGITAPRTLAAEVERLLEAEAEVRAEAKVEAKVEALLGQVLVYPIDRQVRTPWEE